jgi:peptide/nickel transport system ATP-binding protein
MNDPKHILVAEHVSKTYYVQSGFLSQSRGMHAVDDVSIRLGEKEVLGLIGESGSGKSTLSRLLLGLERPTRGEVFLDGAPISSMSRKRIARALQPVFQDPYSSLNPRETVAQAVSRPLFVHHTGSRAEIRVKVARVIDSVGLPVRSLSSYPSQLSGGQRQRVAIARALVLEPRILICDEPTSALDVSVQAQILNLLSELRERMNVSLILISHNLQVVRFLADRIAVMYFGKIVEEGTCSAVLTAPQHDYTRRLLASALDIAPGQGIPLLPDVRSREAVRPPTAARS